MHGQQNVKIVYAAFTEIASWGWKVNCSKHEEDSLTGIN